MRNKVHGSDKYWRNRRSYKSTGNYNVGPNYVCRNDGRCYYEKCIFQHFKQDAPFARTNWDNNGRRNNRSEGGHGARRKWSRSRSRSLSYEHGRSRSRERNYWSFSRSKSRSPRGGSKEEDYDRYETHLRSKSRGRSRSRGRMSRSRSREGHVSSDWVDPSSRRVESKSRSRRSLSMDRVSSPYPGREGEVHARNLSRERSWSHRRSRSRGRTRYARSRSGSSRRGVSRSGSRTRDEQSRSRSRTIDEQSRSGSRGRMDRSRSGSRGRQGKSDYGERLAWSRRANNDREKTDNRNRIGWSRSGSREKVDEHSRSGSKGTRTVSRSNSRERHWSRNKSARSRSPSSGGRQKGDRYLSNSPDARRISTDVAGSVPAVAVGGSNYATFPTYLSSSIYASNPAAYSSTSYTDPTTFPSLGYPGEHLYPPVTYSASYPSTSTSYATSAYGSGHQNGPYHPEYNQTYSTHPVNQAPSSPRHSSVCSSQDPDNQERKRENTDDRNKEEVEEEMNDTYGKCIMRSVEASINDALMQGIQRGKRLREVQKELSSSKTLTDWELKCMKENSSRTQDTMHPPGVQQTSLHSGDLSRRNEMWTPAHERRSFAEIKQKLKPGDWEIETPYISRSSKASSIAQSVASDLPKMIDTIAGMKTDLKFSSQPKTTKALFPSAAHAANTQPYVTKSYINAEADGSKRMPPSKDFIAPDLSSILSGYKKSEGSESTKEEKKSHSKHDEEVSSSSSRKSKDKKEKKKKKKKKKRASSSESEHATDTEDSDTDKKEAPERSKWDSKEQGKLLDKKNELLNRVHQLVVEREKLEQQREDIIQNHKGDGKSLRSILEDNSHLIMEIHRQILNMDEMIRKVNDALGAVGLSKERHGDQLLKRKSPSLPPPLSSIHQINISTLPNVSKVENIKIPPPLMVQVKYVDQGMHWCKLCGIFCNTITGFIEHLECPTHMENVKVEKKTWLAKAARPEKERIAPNAQTITEPLQGTEFLHSLQVFYCSLCDLFLRNKKDAILHPETKQHVSTYKAHLTKNSMYEASFLTDKMGAYATFKIKQEKQRREAFEAFMEEKGPKKNPKEEAMEKRRKELREEMRKEGRSREEERGDNGDGREYRSIRVASRGALRKRDRDEDERRHDERDRRKRDYDSREDRGRRDHEDRKGHDRRKQDRGRGERSSRNDTPSPRHSRHNESKRDNLAADKNTESGRSPEKIADIEKESKDENRLTPTPATKSKLPLIGKMPFFKKKGSSSSAKEKGLEKDDDESESTVMKQEMEEGVDIDKKDCSSEAALSDPVIVQMKQREVIPLKSEPQVNDVSEYKERQEKIESVRTFERKMESGVDSEKSILKDEHEKTQPLEKKRKQVKEKSDLESVGDVKNAEEGKTREVEVQEEAIPSIGNKRNQGGKTEKEEYKTPTLGEDKGKEDEKDEYGGKGEGLGVTEMVSQSSSGKNSVGEETQVALIRNGNKLPSHLAPVEDEVGVVEQDETEMIMGRVEEEAPQPYPSVIPIDFYSGEELAQDDGSGFYHFEDGTVCMEDYSMMDMNSMSAMGLHTDPLTAAGYASCGMMPPTSMGIAMDPSMGMYSVHHMGGVDPSCVMPEDPLFPPGTEPNVAGENEDDLDEVPMDTEEEPQDPCMGDISDTLKHIGQSDHFDKLEEMKLLGIDIDDVAAT
ncbi:uncharacterized protein LOC143018556 [Oratosquilla oratoria]|uniref:uncharacterized protein LOC143018556 n=1 Tax=Oratosquilla oratoria TaxID=337810 RepID=UPI003F760FD3